VFEAEGIERASIDRFWLVADAVTGEAQPVVGRWLAEEAGALRVIGGEEDES
jgi:hypothetical protein